MDLAKGDEAGEGSWRRTTGQAGQEQNTGTDSTGAGQEQDKSRTGAGQEHRWLRNKTGEVKEQDWCTTEKFLARNREKPTAYMHRDNKM